MNNHHLDSEKKYQQLQLGIYYLPIIGIIPSLWTLSRNQGDRHQKRASRLSITLTLIWLCSYMLLSGSSSQTSDLISFRLLYTNALITTGYFLTCLILILRLKQGKLLSLPGINKLTDKIPKKLG